MLSDMVKYYEEENEVMSGGLNAAIFRQALKNILQQAQAQGQPFVDVLAGNLHRQVGGYPGKNHRMPLCCSVMRSMMMPGDQVLQAPPKGQGASLRIRYKLPRLCCGG
jgi:hypothetical protein